MTDDHRSGAAGGLLHLTAGPAQLTVDPQSGGRATSLMIDDLELFGSNEKSAVGWGCYPMVPWPGKLTGNAVAWAGRSHPMPLTFQRWALHGLTLTLPWQVLDHGPDTAVLGLELGTRPVDPWPWPCDVVATWRLRPDHLETVLEVRSREQEFPAELGWHPWFRRQLERGEPAQIYPRPGRMYLRGDDLLPTGELAPAPAGPYDDCFEIIGGEVGLRWPGALDVTFRTDCESVVIYTELPAVVCMEPQTAPPDWINRHPVIVRPGAPRITRTDWLWTSDS